MISNYILINTFTVTEESPAESQIRTNAALLERPAVINTEETAEELKEQKLEKISKTVQSAGCPLHLSAQTLELARQLHENLRLVLEPNKANQLQYVHCYSYFVIKTAEFGEVDSLSKMNPRYVLC